ncbi:putative short chain dehydrogenase/ reductase [Lophiostoma macrostomum CBS 122681]|uniref:Putative short chain dehydrogenase/ reductase n=1 Tax=Lophiostoma macrostomum CBS 122681 TaxID=1314788 RepID=A0A6A6SXB9_9PLEO|nr:putative short chain dehydrogenase/ reductase [Lophiostoma macrostomum CBS 122681]
MVNLVSGTQTSTLDLKMRDTDMQGKLVFIVGGSAGLGLEIGKVLVRQGASITIFARDAQKLADAKKEIQGARVGEDQGVEVVVGDMSCADTVHTLLSAQPTLPDTLYCVAGGASTELGFIVDLDPEAFERSMRKNYYSSLWPARWVLKEWVEDDKRKREMGMGMWKDGMEEEGGKGKEGKERKIVLVNSTASLVPAPGYGSYTASKLAQRGLAETLRLECTRYTTPLSTYTTQCIFAHNFISPTFLHEQTLKPALTKRLEGSTASTLNQLEKQFPYAAQIAPELVKAVARGDFAVVDGRFESQLCLAVGRGASPMRGWGVWDSALEMLGWLVWPWVRWAWRRECEGDAWRVGEDGKGK